MAKISSIQTGNIINRQDHIYREFSQCKQQILCKLNNFNKLHCSIHLWLFLPFSYLFLRAALTLKLSLKSKLIFYAHAVINVILTIIIPHIQWLK
jgi:hypothetical protein